MVESVITVQGLVKRYGDLTAVDHIDFEVFRGEVFSMLGPNGAGKTTTVEIMECLRTKTDGDVTILGMDIERKVRDIKKRIGVLPQDFNAFDLLTVKENIEYFGGMFKHQLPADDLIEIVNLGEKRDVYFKNLSGGLKQRVGVAISMVNDPDIIFLDEPTTGLDPVARREVWEVIKDLKSNGKTIILTTHYMEEAEVLSDRVGIIDRGKFITMGSPNDIIDRYGTGTTMVVRGGDGSALEKLQGLSSKVERKGNDIVVNVDSKDVLPEAIMRLHEGDVHYEEIMLRRSTLEDVFLTLTGKRLENGEEVKKKGRGKK
ncbi:MAG: ABC transporter ATP-binding protein [Methanomassiliicoccus sp.]|mgnify:CR=1 FL=1|jgi:ABC-2 type transport system ATP-binding protein|nr:ABC transporter ATP-binding protein [Methanomassiliicoccus sp.]